MKFDLQDKKLVLYFEGRVDSVNAGEVEAEISSIKEGKEIEAIELDFDCLDYISSAGLRIILRLIKECKNLKVVNVKSEVYEVLEMTGFTEMVEVVKAFRKLSVDGCKVIGQGANGKVYRYDRDTIVKVYFNKDALPDIKRERELARTAFVLGIPTAIPYDVVRVGETYGSVFELLSAKSFDELIGGEDGHKDEYISLYVDLMKKIHSTIVKEGSMPDMREVAIDWVHFLKDYIDSSKYDKLLSMVEAVPKDLHMMHGDYHVKNVMMQNGEVLLIDMDTLCYGNPIFELASIFNAYVGYTWFDKTDFNAFMGMSHELTHYIWEKTLRLYLGTESSERIEEVRSKAMLIGFVRIMRRTIRRGALETAEGREIIAGYKKVIEDLIDKVDTLLI